MIIEPYIDVATALVEAWRRGQRRIRAMLLTAVCLLGLAILVAGVSEVFGVDKRIATPVAATLGIIGALLAVGVVAYGRVVERSEQSSRIEEVERRVVEDPKATQAAWELAQVKLESYLSRNLHQVRSIYWLIVVVMMVGFGFIGYGVVKLYEAPQNLPASVVAAASGILVNFIGTTFLVIYRSTMEQAKDYVTILERINAVGMAIQILDSIEEADGALRRQVMAEIAKELLGMYRVQPTMAPVGRSKRRS